MSLKCQTCGIDTIFYVWTSSRNFPRHKLFEKSRIINKKIQNQYKKVGYPVCMKCREQLDE